MVDSEEEYIKKNNVIQQSNSLNILDSSFFKIANLFVSFFYLLVILSVYMQFVPILNQNWFNLGTGKFVGIAAICGIFCVLTKNYFAAFFISLFSSFFVFHEVIIFYDNYAIELGQELGSNGVFRLVFGIFADAFKIKYGAFWALLGSVISFISVSIVWISNTVTQNRLSLNKVSE